MKQLGDFLLGHFITSQVTSQEHPFGNTFDCLHKTQQGNKCPQLLLPAGSVNEIEHGRRGFSSSAFQPGLINSNKSGEVISHDTRQARSYSLLFIISPCSGAQSLTFATPKGHKVKFYRQI